MIRTASAAALFLAGLALPAIPASAASFDCTKATTPFEKAICADPDLSLADDRLAKTYATAIGGLSPIALEEMRSGQRDWLAYAQRACTRDAEPLTTGTYDERGITCLNNLFDSRSRVLEQSRMIDGIRFYPVAWYNALLDTYERANPDYRWPVAQHELSTVQIDGNEGFMHAFNDTVREEVEQMSGIFAAQGGAERIADDGSSDSTISLAITELAGTGRITLTANSYWYGHGAAHGNYTIDYRHYLVEQGRFLKASDMFTGKKWETALLDLAIEAAREEHGEYLFLDDTSYIAESVIDPSRWDLSSRYDLIIQFQPYEIAAYAYGAPTVRIPWEKLGPYMTEDADRIRSGY